MPSDKTWDKELEKLHAREKQARLGGGEAISDGAKERVVEEPVRHLRLGIPLNDRLP